MLLSLSTSVSLDASIFPQLSVLSLESFFLGGSFLFAKGAEGEISYQRAHSGHRILPPHNRRNPGGSRDGLAAPLQTRMSKRAPPSPLKVCSVLALIQNTDKEGRRPLVSESNALSSHTGMVLLSTSRSFQL